MQFFTLRKYPNRNAWLAGRRQRLQASDLGPVCRRSQYSSRFSIYVDKVDPRPPEKPTELQEWGHRLEGAIAQKFREVIDSPLRDLGDYAIADSTLYPWLGATLDRLVCIDGNWEPVELKCVDCHAASAWRNADTIPESYIVQAHAQMIVAGARRAWFAVLAGGNSFRYHAIDLDRNLARDILKIGRAFWADNVCERNPPEIDGSEPTSQALDHYNRNADEGQVYLAGDQWLKLGRQYDRALQREARCKKLKTEIGNRFRSALGERGDVGVLADDSGFALGKKSEGRKRSVLRKKKITVSDDIVSNEGGEDAAE